VACEGDYADTAALMTLMPVILAACVVVGTSLLTLPVAVAGPGGLCNPCDESVSGNGDGIDVRGMKGVSQTVPGRGDPARTGPAEGRNEYELVEEELAPACVGNNRGDTAICSAATLSCPSEDQTRYWVWHRVTRVVVEPPSRTVGEWRQEPGSFCLGPDDPGLPTIGRVIAQVRTDFQRLPLPKFAVRTDPSPQTLVNVPTAFSAGTAEAATFTPTILGTRVTITAKPTQWDWTFGDGATLTTTTPGTPRRPDVAHEYTRVGQMSSSVRASRTSTVVGGPCT
jgi:hypothetical protein